MNDGQDSGFGRYYFMDLMRAYTFSICQELKAQSTHYSGHFSGLLFAATKLEEMKQYLPLHPGASMLTVDSKEGSSNSVFLSCNTNLLRT